MLAFLLGLLGVLVGIALAILVIYLFIRRAFSKIGVSAGDLIKVKNEIENEEINRPKQIGGMTNIFLPQIVKDIKNFSLDEIYLLTEKSLRTIFNAIENKDIELLNDKDFNLINNKLKLQLQDLIDSDIIYKYDDIVFHKHAIKSYTKDSGVYKLVITSSLEYYYKKIKDGKDIDNKGHKVQTSYNTTFVYIRDKASYEKDVNIYGLNCPNCGAVINSLDTKNCSYCHTGLNIEVIDLLKCWKIIDYKMIN